MLLNNTDVNYRGNFNNTFSRVKILQPFHGNCHGNIAV